MNTQVNFELAKLLKEKRYKEYTNYRYHISNKKDVGYCRLSKTTKFFIAAPTIAEVVMWLYEKHGIWITVSCDCGNDNLFYSKIFSTEIGIERCIGIIKDKSEPIEAYYAAIEYCLNNLI